VLVDMGQELVEERVGAVQLEDLVSGQERRQAFLPVIVTAFNFALGLRGWGVAQVHAVEVECRAELGEGLRVVSVEEGVAVHIQGQGQTVGLEDAREEVEVGQEGFGEVEAGPGVEACGVVEDVQEDLLVGAAGQPSMGRGIVLPERAVVPGLPAFDGFGLSL